MGSIEMGTAEIGSAKINPAQMGFAEVSIAEIGRAEIRPIEIGFTEMGIAEIRSAKIRPYIWVVEPPLMPCFCSFSQLLKMFLVSDSLFLVSATKFSYSLLTLRRDLLVEIT